MTDLPTATVRGQQVRFPWWVARNKMTAAAARAEGAQPSLLRVLPRFQDASEKRIFNRACGLPSRATGQHTESRGSVFGTQDG